MVNVAELGMGESGEERDAGLEWHNRGHQIITPWASSAIFSPLYGHGSKQDPARMGRATNGRLAGIDVLGSSGPSNIRKRQMYLIWRCSSTPLVFVFPLRKHR
jgi:hypothetical protein